MRVRFTFVLLTVGLLKGNAPAQLPELVAEQGYADLILHNGKIVSMEDRSIRPGATGRTYRLRGAGPGLLHHPGR